MTEQQLPQWGNDPLSTFLKDAEHNTRVTSLNFTTIYALLQHLHIAFQRVEETIEQDNREELLVTRFLVVRTHSSFLASIRLAMSGQLSEAYAILRIAIEEAWYALHIGKDPQPLERAKIWLCRNDDESSKSKCKNEFKVANVFSTHQSLDPTTAQQLHQLYEKMIDFGAHPNQRGLLLSMGKAETPEVINYQVGILFPDKPSLVITLRMAVAVAVRVLKVFQLIFSERFKIMGLDSEIEELVRKLN